MSDTAPAPPRNWRDPKLLIGVAANLVAAAATLGFLTQEESSRILEVGSLAVGALVVLATQLGTLMGIVHSIWERWHPAPPEDETPPDPPTLNRAALVLACLLAGGAVQAQEFTSSGEPRVRSRFTPAEPGTVTRVTSREEASRCCLQIGLFNIRRQQLEGQGQPNAEVMAEVKQLRSEVARLQALVESYHREQENLKGQILRAPAPAPQPQPGPIIIYPPGSSGPVIPPPSGGPVIPPPSGGPIVAPPSGGPIVTPPSGGPVAPPPSGGPKIAPPGTSTSPITATPPTGMMRFTRAIGRPTR